MGLKVVFSLFLLSLGMFSHAQNDTILPPPQSDSVHVNYNKISDTRYDDVRLLYKNQFTIGVILHTRGWGLNYRGYKIRDAFQKTFFNIDFVTQKHPKEQKISSFDNDARSYVYGKKNDIGIIGVSYGYERVKHEKENLRAVLVSFNYSAGISAAILKPVFLEIAYPYVVNGALIRNEQYDENKHFQAQIYGKSAFAYGLDKLKLIPGIHLKSSVQFEYSSADEYIRAFEVGGRLDVFPKPLPIMARTSNSFWFLNLFIHWQFGKKSN